MTAQQYRALSAPFRGGRRERALLAVNKALTWLCYAVYPVLLIVLALGRDGRFWPALGVPAVSFALVSLVRRGINAPRPYEALDIQPIIQKDTQGKSMPSRHVFSIFMIAMTLLWVLPWAGGVLLILGAALGCIRVIGGVHFPRDVAVGAAAGVFCGVAGFWVLPALF